MPSAMAAITSPAAEKRATRNQSGGAPVAATLEGTYAEAHNTM